jgi:nucleoside-diphosphate-sugar epimerase
MKVLIFGNAGFIGSHLTGRLLKEGHTVVGVDIYDDKIKEYIGNKNLTMIQHDVRKRGFDLDRYVAESDMVVDLIAYANPGLYVMIPLEIFRLNFTENLKIAEACVRSNRRLVQFSTCEVYGKTIVSIVREELPVPEDPRYATFSEDTSDFILGPLNKHRWIYASAKQLLERVIYAYGLESGFNYTIIRPFNFIGPKIDYLPEETDGVPRVFSFFMDALITGKPMKLVDGGHHRRCYSYIDDAIECIYRIIENPGGVCNQQIFNIGTPENEVSIRQLAEMMREIYNKKLSDHNTPLPDIIEVPAGDFYGEGYEDSDRRIPDISKARELLGWKPRWRLHELLEETMRYYLTEYIEYYRKKRKNKRCVHDIVRKALD